MEFDRSCPVKSLRFGFALLAMALATLAHGVIEEPAWHFEYAGGTPNKLVWQTQSGRSYDLFASQNLVTWTHVDGFPKTGTGGVMEYSFVARKRGFFKINLEGPPTLGVGTAVAKFSLGETYADNPGITCTIPMPVGYPNTVTPAHPSVVYFPSGFGGYKYWMSHTPVGSGLQQYENPCIVASNDGNTWETPAGLTNPVVRKPDPSTEGGYNADSNLYWDAQGNQFVLIWMHQIAPFTVKGKTSLDGINWSATFPVFSSPAGYRVLSPSMMRRSDGTWAVWAVDINSTPNGIHLFTCATLTGAWVRETCTFDNAIVEPWHLEVKEYQGNSIMLLTTVDAFGRHQLLFLESDDGLAWRVNKQFPYAICWNGDVPGAGYYKSSFVLGPWFGDGKVGRLWTADSTWNWIKVTDLEAPPSSQLAEGHLENWIDGAIAGTTPNVIGDRFERADGFLDGTAAPSGQTWSCYGQRLLIDGHAVKRGVASGTAYQNLGSNDGVAEVRFSRLPYDASVEFALRYNPANLSRLRVAYGGRVWSISTYTGAWTTLARWEPANIGDGNMDGTALTLEARGKLVKVWMNGRLVASVEQGQVEYDAIKTNTKASIFIGDADTRIDRYAAGK
jgi:hypothetical protein